jgi:hypothetical protein
MIYFIQAIEGGLIKIGYAADPEQRLAALQYTCPVILRIIATMPGGSEEEGQLHVEFHRFRRHAEWFEPDRSLMEFIETHAEPCDKIIKPGWRRELGASRVTTIFCDPEFYSEVVSECRRVGIPLSRMVADAMKWHASLIDYPPPPPIGTNIRRSLPVPSQTSNFVISTTVEWRLWFNGMIEHTGFGVSQLIRMAIRGYIDSRSADRFVLRPDFQ